ncbi:MAG: DNA cytosine methyltransferase [Bacteroides sp.]|nr:DNA cytosine methyltransferase [Bacteroides sp.]
MTKLLYIDLFCGAGGTSSGVNSAKLDGRPCAEVIACVNHDANAIASHAANHPDALHFTEDIRTLELSPLVNHLKRCQATNPDARVVLWASLECTNFSKAKGGQPRDADSRTLAEHLFRYIEALNPDYIQIENVEEFKSWGAVDESGRPVSMDRGRSYIRWVNKIRRYGYDFDHRILNAADYGAYTSRKRFFGIFAKKGLPIAFPEQTHCKNGESGLFPLQKWKPVRDVLDFKDEGSSIFDRKKPLSEKTLERIYAGLIKYVAGGKKAFLIKYNSMSQRGKYLPPSLDDPCPTVATQQRLALASVHFLSKQFSGSPDSKNISVDEPAGTITTIDHHAFISVHYGNGFNRSCDQPASTITTKDKMALIQIRFLDMQYGNGKPASINTVAGAITTNPKHHLVTVKHLPYQTTTESGELAIEIYSTDSPMTVKIKKFMALYDIVEIKMRMLKISELLLIQGFPEDYILIGTQADQKKFIGNAVEVTIARAWTEALCAAVQNIPLTPLKQAG